MKPDTAVLLDHALTLSGASHDIKWGLDVVSVAGKMFCIVGEGRVNYKVGDDEFLALTDLPGVRPAPYLARARWVQVDDCAALDMTALLDGIGRSWRLVVAKLSKRTQRELGVIA
ncbi:MmcQ/YjbR family DNA-binding protein [Crenobacter sp. SG2305]|uniref:MmcQ/YjbR family DNA-binding protein n=1 Tax=Crenobacter oryzisoli TaxID=3056844 RepID=UPI0025AA97DE|nr:MmcQ/YjbR family DNA-binding protein [Crenobacter sp. SG2305]MDN0083728.1 MmcQ/YjbR family DNA-binding protein [Crenobacter sp. SG2305]